ncbi:sphingosine N-acyltransferase lag1 [Lunasporangiospora selenospora]|uniref:Sphingosine N-acyltransferase lag1 n=1 Tax=Lunasporangiospora selenospora TaxID=979761 RepID=A0A9P6FSJ9_9FUNG|nr:sphingosine N-acyltransferase lag1 [Lunasporangiospora selenospora]
MQDPVVAALPVLDTLAGSSSAAATLLLSSNGTPSTAVSSSAATSGMQSSETSLRPRLTTRERTNSMRRKASIDTATGQPYHYDHRRHNHHDPTRGRSPSPPESGGAPQFWMRRTHTDPLLSQNYGAENNSIAHNAPSQPLHENHPKKHPLGPNGAFMGMPPKHGEQTWASFLVQHQLVLSCSVIFAMLLSHALVVSKEARDGHRVDWIGTLTALIPPPIWSSLPQGWTSAASIGGPAMVKKWARPRPNEFNPNEAWSSMAMALQYQAVFTDEATGERTVTYGRGWNDLYMVLLWVMIWTAIREAAMTFFLIPLGQHFGVGEQKKGMTKNSNNNKKGQKVDTKAKSPKEEHAREGKLLRFAEQGWLVLYDGCMWTFGMCLLYQSSYWSDTSNYWREYPKIYLDATMKWYYLIQFAFWVQQLVLALLGIEKRRKDFLEFLVHHIITCLLVGFSYSFNLTSVGHAVLCAMDFSDIVLSLCKMLKYMHKDQMADVGFVFFVITWILSRHYYYGIIVWSCFVEAPKYVDLSWDPSRGMFLSANVLRGFQILLLSLYGLLLFWLAMIARVVVKVVKGENSEDVRSEDEEEAEEEMEVGDEEEEKNEKAAPGRGGYQSLLNESAQLKDAVDSPLTSYSPTFPAPLRVAG